MYTSGASYERTGRLLKHGCILICVIVLVCYCVVFLFSRYRASSQKYWYATDDIQQNSQSTQTECTYSTCDFSTQTEEPSDAIFLYSQTLHLTNAKSKLMKRYHVVLQTYPAFQPKMILILNMKLLLKIVQVI